MENFHRFTSENLIYNTAARIVRAGFTSFAKVDVKQIQSGDEEFMRVLLLVSSKVTEIVQLYPKLLDISSQILTWHSSKSNTISRAEKLGSFFLSRILGKSSIFRKPCNLTTCSCVYPKRKNPSRLGYVSALEQCSS